jgi:glycosyltransferase involved in cell wall biosynthesis
MPARIAFIQSFLPSRSQGGVGHFTHQLASTLAARGHDITVFSLDPAPDHAPYRVINPDRGALWLRSPLLRLQCFPLWAASRDYSKFELVHAMGDSQLMHPGLAVVRTLHGSSLAEARHARRWRSRLVYLSIYPFEVISSLRAGRCVAVSRHTTKHFPWVRDVIPNGIDVNVFQPTERKSAAPSVLVVGHRLYDRKRLDLVLDVFETTIRVKLPRAELWLVCDDRVIAPGVRQFTSIPGEELARLYREAWVFCLPSSYEGFGRPYVEALASGTAVVATPNQGAREILDDGEYGILVAPSYLGAALLEVLENHEKRATFERRGPARARDYTWGRIADRYEEIYESVRATGLRGVSR